MGSTRNPSQCVAFLSSFSHPPYAQRVVHTEDETAAAIGLSGIGDRESGCHAWVAGRLREVAKLTAPERFAMGYDSIGCFMSASRLEF